MALEGRRPLRALDRASPTTLAVVGGPRGRRAAARGLLAVGTTSVVANLVAKPLTARRRPHRSTPTAGRDAHTPRSSSFPSGHTASAYAFAVAVTADLPGLAFPLFGLATAVGYSRVHVGVHYPSDVLAGTVLGLTIGTVTRRTTLLASPLSRPAHADVGAPRDSVSARPRVSVLRSVWRTTQHDRESGAHLLPRTTMFHPPAR